MALSIMQRIQLWGRVIGKSQTSPNPISLFSISLAQPFDPPPLFSIEEWSERCRLFQPFIRLFHIHPSVLVHIGDDDLRLAALDEGGIICV